MLTLFGRLFSLTQGLFYGPEMLPLSSKVDHHKQVKCREKNILGAVEQILDFAVTSHLRCPTWQTTDFVQSNRTWFSNLASFAIATGLSHDLQFGSEIQTNPYLCILGVPHTNFLTLYPLSPARRFAAGREVGYLVPKRVHRLFGWVGQRKGERNVHRHEVDGRLMLGNLQGVT